MDGMRDRLRSLSQDVSEAASQFSSLVSRWQEFNQNSAKLLQWLNEIEQKLAAPVTSKGDLVEIRTQIEQYKNIKREIEQHRPQVQELAVEAVEVTRRSGNNNAKRTIDKIRTRMDAASKKCDGILSRLEQEQQNMQQYYQALQDTERWLLQMSFHMMSYHSLQITNIHQTQEQLQKHLSICKEIKKYKSVIEDVKSKGRSLIQLYKSQVPTLQPQIEQQLTNIQDSYDSLVASAEQNQVRLEEALRKFQAYEETLDQCEALLSEVEPELSSQTEIVTHTIEEAREKLDAIQTILGKLTKAKQNLQAAIQGCVEATSSLSRPSSPEIGIAPPVPEREMQVKIRLQDFIEQAESQVVSVLGIVREWEDAASQKENVEKWVEEKQAATSELQSMPISLQPEVLQNYLQQLEELKQAVSDKMSSVEAIEQKEQMVHLSADETGLKRRLKQLEEQIERAIAARLAQLAALDEYRAVLDDVTNHVDTLSSRLHAVEKPDMGNVYNRSQTLEQIIHEMDEVEKKIESLKAKAKDVAKHMSPEDEKQQQEDIKSVSKKLDDLRKRAVRRLKSLEMVQGTYSEIMQEINDVANWIEHKLKQLSASSPPGYQSMLIEEALQETKLLNQEAERKQVVIQSSEKRAKNLLSDLESNEAASLQNQISKLKDKFKELLAALKNQISKLKELLNKSKKFEKLLDSVKSWIQKKEEELLRIETILANSPELEEIIETVRVEEVEIRTYEETTVTEVVRQSNDLESFCVDNQRQELQKAINDLKDQLEKLKKLITDKTKVLNDLLTQQKELEKSLARIQEWLNQTDVTVSSDLRTDVTEEIIVQQIETYTKLSEEADHLGGDLNDLQALAKSLLQKMKEADKLRWQEQVQHLLDHYQRLSDQIRDRMATLEDARTVQQEQTTQIEENTIRLEEFKTELHTLNRPIGASVEDAQNLLGSCQELINKIREVQSQLEKFKPVGHLMDDYEKLLAHYKELLEAAQKQSLKAKQSVIQREQYRTNVKEITEIITKCTETVTVVEKSSGSISDRLQKYQNLMDQIAECEAKLMSAQDRGEQIGKEGTAGDRNSLMDELQRLRDQLNALKKTVQKLKAEHESIMAEQRKLAEDLDFLVEELCRLQALVRTRPLLDLSLSGVDSEIGKHKALVEEVNRRLNEAAIVTERIRSRFSAESISETIRDQLNEINMLQSQLKREIESRDKYLRDAHSNRREYNTGKEKLQRWLNKADEHLNVSHDGIDFEKLSIKLEDLKTFLKESQSWGSHLNTLHQLSEKICQTLREEDMTIPSQELSGLRQRHECTVALADSTLRTLERDVDAWVEYNNLLNKINTALENTVVPEERPASISALKTSIENVNRCLIEVQKQQSAINELNMKARSLDRRANTSCRNLISRQIANLNQQWQAILLQLENQLSTLTDILNQWEVYTEVEMRVQNALAALEHKLDSANTMSTDIEDYLKNLLSEAASLGDQVNDVVTLSTGVLAYLTSASEDRAHAVRNEVEALNNRHKKLIENIKARLQQLQQEKAALEYLEAEISAIRIALQNMESDVKNLDCFDADVEGVEKTLKQMKDHIKDLHEQVQNVSQETRSRHQRSLPEAISRALSSLEILSENVSAAAEDKERDFKRARTARWEYVQGVEFLVAWLQKAQQLLQDKSALPAGAKETIMNLSSELPAVKEQMERVQKGGQLIVDNTSNPSEKEVVKSTVTSLREQVVQIEIWIEERRREIEDALDAWKKFHGANTVVMEWVSKVGNMLHHKIPLSTLAQAKEMLAEYQGIARESNQIQHQLQDMTKYVAKVGEACSAGNLSDKLEDAEQEFGSTENRLQEEIALLLEMVEEWEQCDRKIKDACTWLDKMRANLDAPQQKRKSLRDQLSTREKMVADIAIQKTKIVMALEKLQVHLRSRPCGEIQTTVRSRQVQAELDKLQNTVRQQCETLSATISQEEQYQQDVQQLRHLASQAEHQLKMAATSPPSVTTEIRKQQQIVKEIELDSSSSGERIVCSEHRTLENFSKSLPAPILDASSTVSSSETNMSETTSFESTEGQRMHLTAVETSKSSSTRSQQSESKTEFIDNSSLSSTSLHYAGEDALSTQSVRESKVTTVSRGVQRRIVTVRKIQTQRGVAETTIEELSPESLPFSEETVLIEEPVERFASDLMSEDDAGQFNVRQIQDVETNIPFTSLSCKMEPSDSSTQCTFESSIGSEAKQTSMSVEGMSFMTKTVVSTRKIQRKIQSSSSYMVSSGSLEGDQVSRKYFATSPDVTKFGSTDLQHQVQKTGHVSQASWSQQASSSSYSSIEGQDIGSEITEAVLQIGSYDSSTSLSKSEVPEDFRAESEVLHSHYENIKGQHITSETSEGVFQIGICDSATNLSPQPVLMTRDVPEIDVSEQEMLEDQKSVQGDENQTTESVDISGNIYGVTGVIVCEDQSAMQASDDALYPQISDGISSAPLTVEENRVPSVTGDEDDASQAALVDQACNALNLAEKTVQSTIEIQQSGDVILGLSEEMSSDVLQTEFYVPEDLLSDQQREEIALALAEERTGSKSSIEGLDTLDATSAGEALECAQPNDQTEIRTDFRASAFEEVGIDVTATLDDGDTSEAQRDVHKDESVPKAGRKKRSAKSKVRFDTEVKNVSDKLVEASARSAEQLEIHVDKMDQKEIVSVAVCQEPIEENAEIKLITQAAKLELQYTDDGSSELQNFQIGACNAATNLSPSSVSVTRDVPDSVSKTAEEGISDSKQKKKRKKQLQKNKQQSIPPQKMEADSKPIYSTDKSNPPEESTDTVEPTIKSVTEVHSDGDEDIENDENIPLELTSDHIMPDINVPASSKRKKKKKTKKGPIKPSEIVPDIQGLCPTYTDVGTAEDDREASALQRLEDGPSYTFMVSDETDSCIASEVLERGIDSVDATMPASVVIDNIREQSLPCNLCDSSSDKHTDSQTCSTVEEIDVKIDVKEIHEENDAPGTEVLGCDTSESEIKVELTNIALVKDVNLDIDLLHSVQYSGPSSVDQSLEISSKEQDTTDDTISEIMPSSRDIIIKSDQCFVEETSARSDSILASTIEDEDLVKSIEEPALSVSADEMAATLDSDEKTKETEDQDLVMGTEESASLSNAGEIVSVMNLDSKAKDETEDRTSIAVSDSMTVLKAKDEDDTDLIKGVEEPNISDAGKATGINDSVKKEIAESETFSEITVDRSEGQVMEAEWQDAPDKTEIEQKSLELISAPASDAFAETDDFNQPSTRRKKKGSKVKKSFDPKTAKDVEELMSSDASKAISVTDSDKKETETIPVPGIVTTAGESKIIEDQRKEIVQTDNLIQTLRKKKGGKLRKKKAEMQDAEETSLISDVGETIGAIDSDNKTREIENVIISQTETNANEFVAEIIKDKSEEITEDQRKDAPEEGQEAVEAEHTSAIKGIVQTDDVIQTSRKKKKRVGKLKKWELKDIETVLAVSEEKLAKDVEETSLIRDVRETIRAIDSDKTEDIENAIISQTDSVSEIIKDRSEELPEKEVENVDTRPSFDLVEVVDTDDLIQMSKQKKKKRGKAKKTPDSREAKDSESKEKSPSDSKEMQDDSQEIILAMSEEKLLGDASMRMKEEIEDEKEEIPRKHQENVDERPLSAKDVGDHIQTTKRKKKKGSKFKNVSVSWQVQETETDVAADEDKLISDANMLTEEIPATSEEVVKQSDAFVVDENHTVDVVINETTTKKARRKKRFGSPESSSNKSEIPIADDQNPSKLREDSQQFADSVVFAADFRDVEKDVDKQETEQSDVVEVTEEPVFDANTNMSKKQRKNHGRSKQKSQKEKGVKFDPSLNLEQFNEEEVPKEIHIPSVDVSTKEAPSIEDVGIKVSSVDLEMHDNDARQDAAVRFAPQSADDLRGVSITNTEQIDTALDGEQTYIENIESPTDVVVKEVESKDVIAVDDTFARRTDEVISEIPSIEQSSGSDINANALLKDQVSAVVTAVEGLVGSMQSSDSQVEILGASQQNLGSEFSLEESEETSEIVDENGNKQIVVHKYDKNVTEMAKIEDLKSATRVALSQVIDNFENENFVPEKPFASSTSVFKDEFNDEKDIAEYISDVETGKSDSDVSPVSEKADVAASLTCKQTDFLPPFVDVSNIVDSKDEVDRTEKDWAEYISEPDSEDEDDFGSKGKPVALPPETILSKGEVELERDNYEAARQKAYLVVKEVIQLALDKADNEINIKEEKTEHTITSQKGIEDVDNLHYSQSNTNLEELKAYLLVKGLLPPDETSGYEMQKEARQPTFEHFENSSPVASPSFLEEHHVYEEGNRTPDSLSGSDSQLGPPRTPDSGIATQGVTPVDERRDLVRGEVSDKEAESSSSHESVEFTEEIFMRNVVDLTDKKLPQEIQVLEADVLSIGSVSCGWCPEELQSTMEDIPEEKDEGSESSGEHFAAAGSSQEPMNPVKKVELECLVECKRKLDIIAEWCKEMKSVIAVNIPEYANKDILNVELEELKEMLHDCTQKRKHIKELIASIHSLASDYHWKEATENVLSSAQRLYNDEIPDVESCIEQKQVQLCLSMQNAQEREEKYKALLTGTSVGINEQELADTTLPSEWLQQNQNLYTTVHVQEQILYTLKKIVYHYTACKIETGDIALTSSSKSLIRRQLSLLRRRFERQQEASLSSQKTYQKIPAAITQKENPTPEDVNDMLDEYRQRVACGINALQTSLKRDKQSQEMWINIVEEYTCIIETIIEWMEVIEYVAASAVVPDSESRVKAYKQVVDSQLEQVQKEMFHMTEAHDSLIARLPDEEKPQVLECLSLLQGKIEAVNGNLRAIFEKHFKTAQEIAEFKIEYQALNITIHQQRQIVIEREISAQLMESINHLRKQSRELKRRWNRLLLEQPQCDLPSVQDLENNVQEIETQIADKLLKEKYRVLETLQTSADQLFDTCSMDAKSELGPNIENFKHMWKNQLEACTVKCNDLSKLVTSWNEPDSEAGTSTTHFEIPRYQNALAEFNELEQQIDQLKHLAGEFTSSLPLSSEAVATVHGDLESVGMACKHLKGFVCSRIRPSRGVLQESVQIEGMLESVSQFIEDSEKVLDTSRDGDDAGATKQNYLDLQDILKKSHKPESILHLLKKQVLNGNVGDTFIHRLIVMSNKWQKHQLQLLTKFNKLQEILLQSEDFGSKCIHVSRFLYDLQSVLLEDLPEDEESSLEKLHQLQVMESIACSQHLVLESLIQEGLLLAYQMDVGDRSKVITQLEQLQEQWTLTMQLLHERTNLLLHIAQMWDQFSESITTLKEWLINVRTKVEKWHFASTLVDLESIRQHYQDLLNEFEEGQDLVRRIESAKESLLGFVPKRRQSLIERSVGELKSEFAELESKAKNEFDYVNFVWKKWTRIEHELSKAKLCAMEVGDLIQKDMPDTVEGTRELLQTYQRGLSQLEKMQAISIDIEETSASFRGEYTTVNVCTVQIEVLMHQENKEQLIERLKDEIGRIEQWLSRLEEFETAHAGFIEWSDKILVALSAYKSQTLEECLEATEKDVKIEIDKNTAEYEEICSLGDVLLSCNVCEASGIEQKVDDIKQRRYRITNSWQERLENLQKLHNDFVTLQDNISEVNNHLSEIEKSIRKARQLKQLEELKSDVENCGANITAVAERCVTLENEKFANSAWFISLHGKIKKLDVRCKNISADLEQLKLSNQEIELQWEKLSEDCNQLETWISSNERAARNPKSDSSLHMASTTRDELRKFEALQHSVQSSIARLDQINKDYRTLSRKNKTESSEHLRSKVKELNARWDGLYVYIARILHRLKYTLNVREEFKGLRESMLMWLTELDLKVTDLEHFSNKSSEERQSLTQEYLEMFASREEKLSYLCDLGVYLQQRSEPSDAVEIDAEISEVRQYWREIRERVQMILSKLRTAKRRDEEESIVSEKHFVTSALPSTLQQGNKEVPEGEMDELSEAGETNAEEDHYLNELESILCETEPQLEATKSALHASSNTFEDNVDTDNELLMKIASCHSGMDVVKHLSSLLGQKEEQNERLNSALSRANVALKKWDSIQVEANEKEKTLYQMRHKWQHLLADISSAEELIEAAEDRQSNWILPTENFKEIIEMIKCLKEFQGWVDKRKPVFVSINERYPKFLALMNDEERAGQLSVRIMGLNQRWNSICFKLANFQSHLQGILLQCPEFRGTIEELLHWLEETESRIQAVISEDATLDRETLLVQHSKFLDLREELEHCEPRIAALQQMTSQLLSSADESNREDAANDDASVEMQTVQNQLNSVTDRFHLLLLSCEQEAERLRALISCDNDGKKPAPSTSKSMTRRNSADRLAPNEDASDGAEDSRMNRCCRFLARVAWTSLPIQALMLLLLGVASLLPISEDDFSCVLTNNFARSFDPMLGYPNGPPPM